MTNVNLPARTWVDLYDATGITSGTQVTVENITSRTARIVESATEPEVGSDHLPLPFGKIRTSTATPVGLWALSVAGGAVNVVEVT